MKKKTAPTEILWLGGIDGENEDINQSMPSISPIYKLLWHTRINVTPGYPHPCKKKYIYRSLCHHRYALLPHVQCSTDRHNECDREGLCEKLEQLLCTKIKIPAFPTTG